MCFIAFLVEVDITDTDSSVRMCLCVGVIFPPMFFWCLFLSPSLTVCSCGLLMFCVSPYCHYSSTGCTNAASNNSRYKPTNSAPAETWCRLFLYISFGSSVSVVSKSHSPLFYWGAGGHFTDRYLKSCANTRQTACTVRHHWRWVMCPSPFAAHSVVNWLNIHLFGNKTQL